MDVNVFHRGQVFPAAHRLKCFVVYACTMGAGSKGVSETVRRFAVDIDRLLYALPEALVSLISERGMRIIKRGKDVCLRVIQLLLREFQHLQQAGKDEHLSLACRSLGIADDRVSLGVGDAFGDARYR